MTHHLLFIAALTLLCGTALIPTTSNAEKVYVYVFEKQKIKSAKRWTLQEWLATKDRMKMMDMWLALNSPSPFEFFIGADYHIAIKDGQKNGAKFTFGAYASIVGLEGEYETAASRWLGSFNLRLFGYHYQSTNLTFRVGLRSEERTHVFRNAFIGGNFTFYFMKFFGVETLYHYYLSSFNGPACQNLDGNRIEAIAFIDFAFLRVFGGYRGENQTLSTSGIPTQTYRSTALVGTRLFF